MGDEGFDSYLFKHSNINNPFTSEVAKVRPAGHMRPASGYCSVRVSLQSRETNNSYNKIN